MATSATMEQRMIEKVVALLAAPFVKSVQTCLCAVLKFSSAALLWGNN